MKILLKILGGVLLVYSIVGLVLHALNLIEGFNHYCEMMLFSFDENHLSVFTLTAAISAALFFAAKAISKGQIRTV